MSFVLARNILWLTVFTVAFLSASAAGQGSCKGFRADADIEVCLGVTADGAITELWFDAIKDRRTDAELEEIRRTKRPLSEAEFNWVHLVENSAEEWAKRRPKLNIPFKGADIPKKVRILLGNQLGDDAFTYGSDTICLDVGATAKIYGPATTLENQLTLIRILDHEYTHIAHHAWILKHPNRMGTPFDRALRNLWVEGFGNYRSLSSQWVDERGTLTSLALNTLSDLQPIFVERLSKLRRAAPDEEDELAKGLSSGPFNKKWGALTVALWLAQESRGDDRRLRKWVKAGPEGIVQLARKHLPRDLNSVFLM